LHLGLDNANALAGRVLYSPAGALANAPNQLPVMNQLVSAAQAKRAQDAAVIHGIFGKPRPQKPDQQPDQP